MSGAGEYRVEVYYKTKRGGVCLGMSIDAFDPDEAEEVAVKRAVGGYPARKVVQVVVSKGSQSRVSIPLQSEPTKAKKEGK